MDIEQPENRFQYLLSDNPDFSVMTTSQTHMMTVISLDVKMRQMKSSLKRNEETLLLFTLKTDKACLRDLFDSHCFMGEAEKQVHDFCFT